MSYSFSVVASSKAEAVEKVKAELENVVTTQPVHQSDKQPALAAAESFIGLLTEPGENECLTVSVSGSLGWRAEGIFCNANVSVGAYVQPKA